jgi:hypothetical protein
VEEAVEEEVPTTVLEQVVVVELMLGNYFQHLT